MTKILYVVFHPISKNDGVTKKINSHIKSWRKNNIDVKVIAFTNIVGDTIIDNAIQIESKSFFISRLILNKKFKYTVDSYKPNFIYARYDTINVNLFYARKYNLIYEINTNDLKESLILLKTNKKFKDLLRLIIYFLFRRINLNLTHSCVFVTSDLANQYRKFNVKTIISPNTIDLNTFKVVKEINTNKVSLFFIATPNQPWHGIEYIIEMSKKMPKYLFNIVGINGMNTSNLFFHGYLDQNSYINILKKCHICLGSFGIHKYGLKESSPLKVREYLAYGYPTILGYNDYPISSYNLDFIYQVDVHNINFNKIQEFIETYKNYIVKANQVCEYIDSDIIEKEKLAQFI
jgi:hypothetical protein